ncbi:MAG: shikimate dehydrogenase [Anaerolineales bacterium]|nr:shikimate dehydrogenase [Anaerolineales bacterium]
MNETSNVERSTLNVQTKYYSFGLIGYPLSHSLSPQIHNAALQALGLDGKYNLHPIPPFPEEYTVLEDLLKQVRQGEISGLNVTIPHKQNVIPLLDHLTPAADTIGAVNTIFRDEDQLVGDNTDAPGFFSDLENFIANNSSFTIHHSPSAIILGAGGSARAVAYALLTNGYSVTIAARRIEQAREVRDQGSGISEQISVVSLSNWFPIPDSCSLIPAHCSLIINATPIGMHPQVNASPWPAGVPFPENTAVYDLVYNPRETLLVRQARAAGLPATTGLGMLVEQAALAFERWTGLEAPRDIMLTSVESHRRY